MNTHPAILLLGPTGSGKTPLGLKIAERRLWNKTFYHFDFGYQLRYFVKNNILPRNCSQKDLAFIKKVLSQGALLENDTFYIAKNILLTFIATNNITRNDIIILNGLPRHTGQAHDISNIASVKMLVHLECSPDIVYARINKNSGGDRTNRLDDSLKEIEKKLEIYKRRTKPLIEHYHKINVPCVALNIKEDSSPDLLISFLQGQNKHILSL